MKVATEITVCRLLNNSDNTGDMWGVQ